MARYELRHLRCFLRLAEELHFSRAAERLHMAQPALSRTLRELEDAVGTRLLERSTRQVRLTAAGQLFQVECRAALGQIERAVTQAQRVAGGMSGELRIGYMDFAINGQLPELVRAFRKRQPDIRLDLRYMPTTLQQEALLERRIDVGFMIGGFEAAPMTSHLLDEDHYAALLPAQHPMASAARVTLAALAAEDFVLGNGTDWAAFRQRLFALCRARGFFPAIVQEASSSEGIFGLVAAGSGVSVYAGCARNIQRRGIAVRRLEDVRDSLPIHAVWERDTASPTLRRFAEFILREWRG
jgi:DNA-binding transcriptional LysR family regulator